jgi:hypothetical protein
VVIFTDNEMLIAFNAPDALLGWLIRAPLCIVRPHEVFGAEPAFAETGRFIKVSALIR